MDVHIFEAQVAVTTLASPLRDENTTGGGLNITLPLTEKRIIMKFENQTLYLAGAPPSFKSIYLIKTIVLGILFLISFIGNTATLIQMYRMRRRRSTINTLIVNLAIADLLVTFFCMASEAVWASTIQWLAGSLMCRLVKYIQGFSLLLSTYITVVISLDRCCVIMDPISRNKAPQRVRIMIVISWFLSALFSVPQLFVFSVHRGPFKEDFYQCGTYGIEKRYNRAYNIFCLFIQFMIPLGIMSAAYGLIFCTISRKSREFGGRENSSTSSDHGNRGQVRNNLLRKAKRKALRMSLFIVAAFIFCWFPYYVIFTGLAFGYWDSVSQSVIMGLLTIGVSNSMLNPIIYGAFQLCKVHKPRSWKKDDFARNSGITPFLHRRMWHSGQLTPGSNQAKFVSSEKKAVMVTCNCNDVGLRKHQSSSLSSIVVKSVTSDTRSAVFANATKGIDVTDRYYRSKSHSLNY